MHIVILTLRRWSQEHQDFKVISGSIASFGRLGLHETGGAGEKGKGRGTERSCMHLCICAVYAKIKISD